jgi:hypothetical protein
MQILFANRFTRGQETDGADSCRVPGRRRVLKRGATSLAMPFLLGRLSRAQGSTQSCVAPIPVDRSPSNGGSCPTPFLGSTRTAITIRRQGRMSNSRTSTTSRESWRVAADSTAWAPTTRGIASRGALRRPTIAIWQVSTGPRVRHDKAYSRIPDSRSSRDRRFPQTRYTIFILPFRLRACTG